MKLQIADLRMAAQFAICNLKSAILLTCRRNWRSRSCRLNSSAVGRPCGQWCVSSASCRWATRAAISSGVSGSPACTAAVAGHQAQQIVEKRDRGSAADPWRPGDRRPPRGYLAANGGPGSPDSWSAAPCRRRSPRLPGPARPAPRGAPASAPPARPSSRPAPGSAARCVSSVPAADAPLELLEQDALVQGVLIDDQHALGRFQDEIGVVELDGLEDAGDVASGG